MRSLVVQTSFIGDVILTTPLLERLAGDGDVDVVTTPAGATLLASHPAVSRVIVYDKRRRDGGIAGFVRVAREARGARRAYLAQGSMRSAALALAAGCAERVGFSSSAGRWLYTERVEYRDDWQHARRLLSLAGVDRATGVTGRADDRARANEIAPPAAADDAIRPSLHPTLDDVAAVDALLADREETGRAIVAVAPGSVWATKRWPRYGELSRLLSEDYDIALVGGAADADAAAEIRRHVPAERIIDATGNLSLLGSAELIRRSVAIVTNDSSPQHLASAMGTPTVTIFGPTVPAFGFGPLAPGSITAGVDELACRPCDRHGPQRCPLGHWRCMNDITPNQVNRMIRSVIAAESVR